MTMGCFPCTFKLIREDQIGEILSNADEAR